MADFRYEQELVRGGCAGIAGIDEAGRGALFGPVTAAAVILPMEWISGGAMPAWAEKINDSKLLPPTKRKELAVRIVNECGSFGIGFASCGEIDDINIFQATCLAMRRAVDDLGRAPDHLLIDGLRLKDVDYPQTRIVKGDLKSRSIAAASIVAKVFRDSLMESYDGIYEGYGLARHKGYGTSEHYGALREKGPTGLHRLTFKLR